MNDSNLRIITNELKDFLKFRILLKRRELEEHEMN